MFYSMLKKQTYKRSIWDLDMKICFVAPANNYHIKKWCKWFVEREHEIHVVSFIKDDIPGVTVHFVNTGVGAQASAGGRVLQPVLRYSHTCRRPALRCPHSAEPYQHHV